MTPELTQMNSLGVDQTQMNNPELDQISELINDFSDEELDEFLGNLNRLAGEKEINDKVNKNPSYAELFQEGMQESTGKLLTQEMPGFKQIYDYADIAPMPTFKEEMARSERDLGFLQNLIKGAGAMLGDIPAMFVGGVAGGLAGAELGPLAVLIGGAGTFALPTLLKTSHQEYQKFFDENPEANPTFGEYLQAAGNVTKETGKSAIIGGATAMVAPLVKVLSKVPGFKNLLSSTATRKVVEGVGEAATITTGTAAFQGEWPDADQFASNLLLLAGFHGTKAGARKFGEWARGKGLTQAEAIEVLDSLDEAQMKAFDEAESIDDIFKKPETKQIEQKPKEIETSDKPKEIEFKEPEKKETKKKETEKEELFDEFPDEPKKDSNELRVIEEPVKKEPVKEPKDLKETRGKGRNFHGSKQKISSLSSERKPTLYNDYGDGFYTTDAINVANNYAGEKGQVYELTEKKDLRMLDMDTKIKDLEFIPGRILEYRTRYHLPDELIHFKNGNMKLKDYYDFLSEELPIKEASEHFNSLIRNYKSFYDGMTFIEERKGVKKHKVNIYFKPKDSLEIKETSVNSIVSEEETKVEAKKKEVEAKKKEVKAKKKEVKDKEKPVKEPVKEEPKKEEVVSEVGKVDGKVAKVSKNIPTEFSSTKVINEPKVSKDRGLVETRGKGRIFHGSATEIGSLQEGYYSTQNIYGQGLYTTDAIDISRGYANQKRKPGFIYEIEEKPGLKFFDLEVPIKDFPKDIQENISSAVSEFIHVDGNQSLRDIYDEMRTQMESADTIQEYLQPIQENIEDQGYDGYSHRGGLITKNPEHAVKIYFSPHKSVNINKIDPKEFQSTVKKAKKVSKKITETPAKVEVLRKEVGDLKRNLDSVRADLKRIIQEKDPSKHNEKEILRSIVSKVYKELQAAKKKLAELEKAYLSKAKKPTAKKPTPPTPPTPPPSDIVTVEPEDLPPPGNLQPVENGKVVEFEGVVIEEPIRDATYYERLSKKISAIMSRFNKFWNVEAPFKEVGGNDAGRKAKLYYNTIEKHQRDAIDAIKAIKALKYDRRDRGILTLLSEAKELPEQYREKYGAGYDLIRKYFDESFEQLKEVDALIKPFPESLISRIEKENEEITKKILTVKGKKAKENLFKKRQANIEAIKNLKDSAFVHIPYGEWFTDQYGSGEGGQRIINAINSLTNKQRKTFHIRDLLKSGAIKAKQIDIADIIGSYGLRKGKDLAIYGLMKASVKEGLASRKPHKNYERIPKWASNVANQFYVHPVVYDYLIPILKREPSSLNNLLGKVKGWQFYNPFFLPGYDMFQAAMLGTFQVTAPKQTGRYFFKAMKDIYYRSKDYHEAMELGLASSPFNITKGEYRELIKQSKQTLSENLIDWASPKIISKLFNLSSNLAWQLDRWVRMASYNRLLELGHTPQEAAEIAAIFHADYASVPQKSRRALNLAFFTPTFKVVMGKLFKQMAKSSYKVVKSILKNEDIDPVDRIYAEGLVNAVVISGAMHAFFTANGFKADIYAYRYSKVIKTEDGEDKELVVVMPSPINLPIKYIGRAYNAFTDPGEINAWSTFARQMSWEIHPLWRMTMNIVRNADEAGRPVTDTIGNTPAERLFDRVKYAIKSLGPITTMSEVDEESEKSKKQMEKEIGQAFGIIFRPFTNHYIRDSFEKRHVLKIKRLVDALKTRQIRAMFDPKTDPLTEAQVKRYLNQIQKVVEQLDEHNKEN
jgi:hypothetical protein